MKSDTVQGRRWRSVLRRDARADGSFVYAVRTTGIYCRPSCPSRRPKPQSVEFYSAPAAAERAGYRPCKRCVPHQLDHQRVLVHAACNYIATHSSDRVTLQMLSRHIGLSPYYLQRLFKRIIGVSPREYQESRRMASFKRAVGGGGAITRAMLDSGFSSSSRLYEKAVQLGMTPARYRAKGPGLTIWFTTFDSPLGQVLLAATGRGVCSVALGSSAAALESRLRTEFSAADLRRDDRRLHSCRRAISRYFAGRDIALDFPLDIRATAFQRKVWDILRAIPCGLTRSYSEIARRSGRPGAARAVAKAIATNPVALLIPCHRAIRKNGDLAGYRWGVARKAVLLKHERAVTSTPEAKTRRNIASA